MLGHTTPLQTLSFCQVYLDVLAESSRLTFRILFWPPRFEAFQGLSAYILTGRSLLGGISGNPRWISVFTSFSPAVSKRCRNVSSRLLSR